MVKEMFRTAYFIIAKGKIDTLQYDDDVIFIGIRLQCGTPSAERRWMCWKQPC
ncbi:MAG: hypothetical protein ACLSB9_33940 [Hydrogeniiclostridium mannosilyticum]